MGYHFIGKLVSMSPVFLWRGGSDKLVIEFPFLRYDLTDIARIAFMFNGGQSPASILSSICTNNCTGQFLLIHSNRLNHETYPEPCFPAPQLYLLSHTLRH